MNTCCEDNIFTFLGGKWKINILYYIMENESIRFNQLNREMPQLTNTTLTRILKDLEDEEIIIRTDFKTTPPHVEYSLHPKTHEMIPSILKIYQWGLMHYK